MRSSGGILGPALSLSVALFFTSGCFNAAFLDARVTPKETRDVWVNGYLYGLVGTEAIDARYVCATDASGVEVFESGATLALTVVTFGLYTPRIAAVTCARDVAEARSP